ncbi:hypothetical protein Lqui_2492 [Legionella quinlivanii]|uniref:Uncharacterized protein n=1 Tax=Legionella quinlivanii TaxID=45073 RepID=A0A0W0XPH5_9GAMM|nr:hypothetical protein [Legionella quinlivanii]KTD46567.1 hypothetical protein Lqui_2492 [Legionella quinlivanii]SEG09098.1 hypothetical protein SAMN02746093_01836 [Legionella quinlivanii DSM 21216]STY10255.1 Uncharacterised protein [Legionella quinlivanii]
MPVEGEMPRFRYQLNIRDVSVEGDCLKLDFQPDNFFESIKAKFKFADNTFHFKRVLWEGIDYLTVDEIRQFLKKKLFSAFVYSNTEGEYLKIVFPSPPLSDFFTNENTKTYPFISGLVRMKEYLTNALKETGKELDNLVFTETQRELSLESFIHQTYKQKTMSTTIVLLSDLSVEKRSYFLQKFALDALNNYREGLPFIIYCPLLQFPTPHSLMRNALSFYDFNAYDYHLLEKYPVIWVLDGVEQIYQKHGVFNILSPFNNDFHVQNSHFLIGFHQDSNPQPHYFDPIQRVRVIGPRDPRKVFFFNMTANHSPNLTEMPASSWMTLREPSPQSDLTEEPKSLNDYAKIQQISALVQKKIEQYERSPQACMGINHQKKGNALRQALNNAQKIGANASLYEFLNHKEEGAKSILEAFAYHRLGFFGKPNSLKLFEKQVNGLSPASDHGLCDDSSPDYRC